MKIILLMLILGSTNAFWPASEEFVCLPCGLECDKEVHDKAGKCPSCGMALVGKSTLHFKNISVDELCARITSNPNALILDVRSPGEFDGSSTNVSTFGHFKNAININVKDLESRVRELEKYKGKEVLVYCSHAHRSAIASYFLSTHGFANVNNMIGGVSTVDSQSSDCLTKLFVVHSR